MICIVSARHHTNFNTYPLNYAPFADQTRPSTRFRSADTLRSITQKKEFEEQTATVHLLNVTPPSTETKTYKVITYYPKEKQLAAIHSNHQKGNSLYTTIYSSSVTHSDTTLPAIFENLERSRISQLKSRIYPRSSSQPSSCPTLEPQA